MVLLLGALLGLLAQEAAFAAGPAAVETESAAAMPADCMEMMQEQPSEPAQAPCHGLTLDCIAKMGCHIPLAEPHVLNFAPAIFFAQLSHFLQPQAPLIGLSVGPEAEPPILLI